MKKVLFISSLLICALLLTVETGARPLPIEACKKCGTTQQQMFDRFLNHGIGLDRVKTESVYSGVCRWNGQYNPEKDHYAGFFWYLVPETGELAFKARLSFYSPQNPYAQYTAELARKNWFVRPRDLIPEVFDDYSFFDANPTGEAKHLIQYWFRQDFERSERLYVIVRHGYNEVGVCDLSLNSN